jgi:hypothetical protein
MYVLHVLSVVLIYLSVCQSSFKEPIIDELQCLEVCQLEHHRHCRLPPATCGGCLPTYVADASDVCRPLQSSTGQNWHALNEVVQPDKYAEGMQVKSPAVPLQKDEINLDVLRKDASPVGGSLAARQVAVQPAPYTTNQPVYAEKQDMTNEIIFIVVILACSVAALIGIIILVICWFRMHNAAKAASEVDYPAYGSTGPYQGAPRPQSSDRKLAQSAQMFHYQHQKQQMLEIEKTTNGAFKAASEPSSGEDSDEEQFTVYECPGLATAGDLEVRNPLYMEPVDGIGALPPQPSGSHHDVK